LSLCTPCLSAPLGSSKSVREHQLTTAYPPGSSSLLASPSSQYTCTATGLLTLLLHRPPASRSRTLWAQCPMREPNNSNRSMHHQANSTSRLPLRPRISNRRHRCDCMPRLLRSTHSRCRNVSRSSRGFTQQLQLSIIARHDFGCFWTSCLRKEACNPVCDPKAYPLVSRCGL
jgi:hypothetical protein